MRVIVIDGASASSRKSSCRLINVVAPLCWDKPHARLIEIKHSLWKRKTMRRISRAVEAAAPREEIVFVAKSQGAWRLLDWFRRQDKLNYRRMSAVTIDPHHWYYGDMPMTGVPVGELLDFTNYLQRNSAPLGAIVEGGRNVIFCAELRPPQEGVGQVASAFVDHWNIVDNSMVHAAIRSVFTRATQRGRPERAT